MKYYTPLRYPGGKGKLANFIKLLIQQNNLLDGHYVEPYAGGAGVAFALLFDEYASHVHINDLNRSVYAFWYAALHETEALCEKILSTPVTINEWHKQKALQNVEEDIPIVDLAFSTFFLNRTNRSGILTGGVIGGKDQKGTWKIDARFNKENLVRRIRRIGRHRSRITVYNEDAAQFIRSTLPSLPKSTLVYLDPPYYVKGQGLYENFYEHNDHLEVATLVSKIKQHWLVTYDAAPEIEQFYGKHRQITYALSYSAADRYKGSELMFFSKNLSVPSIENPALVKSAEVNRHQIPLAL